MTWNISHSGLPHLPHKFTINVHFYKANMSRKDRDEHIVNQITTWMDPPYCHCEVEFMNTQSLAVYANQCVRIRQREFDPNRYDTIKLNCEEHEYNRAFATAHSLVNLPFSWLALLNCHFNFHRKIAHGVCCSQICAEVLQAGNLLSEDINPAFVSPSRLHSYLHASSNKSTDKSKDKSMSRMTSMTSMTNNDALDWKIQSSPSLCEIQGHIGHI